MTSPPESPSSERSTFRSTLIRVVAIQVGTLLVLWLMQARYTG
jgi:hypothetical protein